MKRLHIGNNFSLPLELVISTQAILARKRSGKSYTASVQAEELLAQNYQIAVIDPTGAWHGLKSSADGQRPGFAIVVFGGEHADAPLEASAGSMLARALVERGFSAVFDVSLMGVSEAIRFVADFTTQLFQLNREAMHLFIDEADSFAPEKPFGEETKSLHAIKRLVKQGGIRGIGVTMITQRPQQLAKSVLSQVDILTVLRMSHPLDLNAAADWIATEVSPQFAAQVKAALPSLPVGTAFICSASLHIGERVEIRQRTTFNSGATPKPGEKRIQPKALAQVDIKKLGEEIQATIQRAKEEDPKALRQIIAQLRKDIAVAQTAKPAIVHGAPIKTQPDPEAISRIRAEIETDIEERLDKVAAHVTKIVWDAQKELAYLAEKLKDKAQWGLMKPAISKRADRELDKVRSVPVPVADSRHMQAAPHPVAPRPALMPVDRPHSAPASDSARLTGPQRSILRAMSKLQGAGVYPCPTMLVALLTGYSNLASTGFAKGKSGLSSAGLIRYPSPGTLEFTEAGIGLVERTEPIKSNEELHERLRELMPGPVVKILDALIHVYPSTISRQELAERTGYSNLASTGFAKGLSRASSLGLAEYPDKGQVRASEMLFPLQ